MLVYTRNKFTKGSKTLYKGNGKQAVAAFIHREGGVYESTQSNKVAVSIITAIVLVLTYLSSLFLQHTESTDSDCAIICGEFDSMVIEDQCYCKQSHGPWEWTGE